MNPSTSCVFFFLLVVTTPSLISITTGIGIGTTAAADDLVYDVTGKKVLNNVPYYIGPAIWAKGGGIKLTDHINGKKICPFNVVQDPGEVNIGGHFSFTHIAKRKYLVTSTILGIDSGTIISDTCKESTFWQIPDAEAKAPSNFITSGGSFDTAESCFQVVDYPKPTIAKVHSYMLQHCPYFCGAGSKSCFNVSIYVENGVRHLATSGAPFEFVFRKAK